MGVTQLIEPFYQLLPAEIFRRAPTPGQLCWVPVPFLEHAPFIFDVERASSEEHYATQFSARPMTDQDFRKKERLPIKALRLKDTEELLAVRAKRRPAIILSDYCTVHADLQKLLREKAKRHLQEKSLLVIPLYGIESESGLGGFPPIMVARIKVLLYDQFFFCPACSEHGIRDSVARLDRIQTIMPVYPAFIPTKAALADEAFALLRAMVKRFTCGQSHEADVHDILFTEFQDVLADSLAEEYRLTAEYVAG